MTSDTGIALYPSTQEIFELARAAKVAWFKCACRWGQLALLVPRCFNCGREDQWRAKQ